MSLKHTQGPWKFFPRLTASENHKGFRIVGGRASWLLADVMPLDSAGEEGEANARLMAAATELLDALEDLVALLPDPELDNDDVQKALVLKAKAAIAKATEA